MNAAIARPGAPSTTPPRDGPAPTVSDEGAPDFDASLDQATQTVAADNTSGPDVAPSPASLPADAQTPLVAAWSLAWTPPHDPIPASDRPTLQPEIDVLDQLGARLAGEPGRLTASSRPGLTTLGPALLPPVDLRLTTPAPPPFPPDATGFPSPIEGAYCFDEATAPQAILMSGLSPAAPAADLVPQVPGTAATLQAQALQQRLDDALRWMAGQGVHTAQLRVAPEALGPITIQLQLSGDTAHLALISPVEATRQALEANLSSLKDSLAQQGLQLAQSFVGSEQQQTAQPSRDDRTSRTEPPSAEASPLQNDAPASASRSQRHPAGLNGRVDIFA